MGEIWFIRHGQASYGTANYDRLSPLGHQQADWLGAHLAKRDCQFDQVVSGTLRRHRETAEGILRHFAPRDVNEDERFNEMEYFALERAFAAQSGHPVPVDEAALPLYFARVMAAWERDEILDAPESFGAFRDRVLGAVKAVMEPEKRCLIVSSGGPKGILMRHVLGLEGAAMTDVVLGTYNSALSQFRLVNERLKLSSFNGLPHLDGSGRAHARTFI